MSLYVYLAAAIVFMAAIAGAGIQGHRIGADSIRVQWQAQALKDAQESAAKLKAVSDAYRAKEQENARKSQLVSKRYQKEIANAETAKIIALDGLRTGNIRLRDPNAKPDACGDSTAKAGPGTGGHNGRTSGQLSDEASRFLVGLASECDAVASQLGAAQALIRADRQ